jgi:hypothetical protein
MKLFTSMFILFALAVVLMAGTTEVKPLKVFKGSVADVELQKKCPEVIATPVVLKETWQALKLKEAIPDIDFCKNIIIAGTTNGSILNLSATIDEKGDMKTIGMASMDLGEGFRYVMIVVSREGVKTVNGKSLPTSWKVTPVFIVKGSVADFKLSNNISDIVRNTQTLKDIWKAWKITDKMPEVDFNKQIVVISTSVGSYLTSEYTMDIKGNLAVNSTMTKDIAEGFRYQLAVINIENVITINNKPLPK